MRVLSIVFGLLLMAPVAAQAPAPRAASRQLAKRPSRPDGSLAQVMRAIMFPNANIIFDVQTNDPGVEKKLSDDVTRGALITFANIYSGWDVVQNAAAGDARATGAGALAGTVGFLVGGLTQYTFGDAEVAIAMWTALALLMRLRESE